MENKKLIDKIKSTFDNEVPDVLSKIKADPNFRIPPKQKSFSVRNILKRRITLSLTSLIIVTILIITVSSRTNNVVASTVTLDVNPSIEITLNDEDIVISILALNDDGEEVVQSNIEYKGLTLDEVLEVLVNRLSELGYIVTSTDQNNIILIQVESKDEAIQLRLEEKLQSKLQYELGKYSNSHWVLNAKNIELTDAQKIQVKNSNLLSKYSAAKISLVYRINQLDENYTLIELARMTVRDLYDLFIELETSDNLPEKDRMPPSRKHHPGNGYIPNQVNSSIGNI
jgi:hypothetical protein